MTNLSFLKEYDKESSGVFVLKRDHTVLFWNNTMVEWTGVETNKILNDKIFLFFENLNPGLIQELFESIFKSAIELTLPYPKYQYLIPSQDNQGNNRSFKIHVKPVQPDNSNDIFYIFYLDDQT